MIYTPPTSSPPPTVGVRHSRLGIASLTISVAVGLAFLALFIVGGILSLRSPGGQYPGQTLVGLIAIALLVVDVVAAGLGIAGLCQSGVNKIFAILGTVFSTLTIVGSIGLIAIGMAYATHANR